MTRRKGPYATLCCAALAALLYLLCLITEPHCLPWWGHCIVGPFLVAAAACGGAIIDMVDML